MMAYDNETKKLHDALVSCKVPDIKAAVDEAHAAGMPANDIINVLGDSMSEVGVLFERGKLFLPHVLAAANGMKAAMELLGPEMAADAGEAKDAAAVVMGTVEGDVHDIGKSICSTMLQCAGFEVHDLGRDVPKANFVEEVKGGCTFCGMSALMTTTMTVQKEIIDMLKDAGLRDKVCVMVGGAPVTQGYADKIGADIYGESASETTRKAKDKL
ncbi:MAG: B12-binding domain-containing protein [Candidatus Methanomethylophilaceae archaeon]|nr:B12-binding domain-containing protein [Candidatus Methanomethylophilaceae archaeon]MBQ7405329.1 B12-binding domain-containing protein [Candidatus Methanomethylophilaceae archaeon]MBR2348898.1 B12-binding domain-containing protein [Candidatus Methanomethylophilaceae archaeon]